MAFREDSTLVSMLLSPILTCGSVRWLAPGVLGWKGCCLLSFSVSIVFSSSVSLVWGSEDQDAAGLGGSLL
jgi:hypothetical protein